MYRRIRTVMRIGNSVAVTIPPAMGFVKGEDVLLTQDGEKIIITKLEIPS